MESPSVVSTPIQVVAELPPNKPMTKTQAIMEKIKTIAKEALHWMAKNWDLILAGLAITAAIALAPIATVEAIVFLSTIVALVIINRLINYVSSCRIKKLINEKEELIRDTKAHFNKIPNDVAEKMNEATSYEELRSSLNEVINAFDEFDNKIKKSFHHPSYLKVRLNEIDESKSPEQELFVYHKEYAVEAVNNAIGEIKSKIDVLESYVKELKARLNK